MYDQSPMISQLSVLKVSPEASQRVNYGKIFEITYANSFSKFMSYYVSRVARSPMESCYIARAIIRIKKSANIARES